MTEDQFQALLHYIDLKVSYEKRASALGFLALDVAERELRELLVPKLVSSSVG